MLTPRPAASRQDVAGRRPWLLGALAATACTMSRPHKRPAALRYSLRDILRGFHRV